MNHTKPKLVGPLRAVCPVCGKTAYSPGGIHPQCAVVRADRAPPRPKETPAKIKRAAQWTKACPQCKRQLHVRRVMCDCGHTFQPRPAAG
jgi:hypothetical protein